MQDRSLTHAWNRLWWVEVLAEQCKSALDQTMEMIRSCPQVVESEAQADGVQASIVLAERLDPPAGLPFLISDLAVNARACLDSAIQSAVDLTASDWRRPAFPIVNDRIAALGGSAIASSRDLRSLLGSGLPQDVIDAVLGWQPHHNYAPGGDDRFAPLQLGYLDVPLNHTALEVRDISNANKHRTVTSVLASSQGQMLAHARGARLVSSPEVRADGRLVLAVVAGSESGVAEALSSGSLQAAEPKVVIRGARHAAAGWVDVAGTGREYRHGERELAVDARGFVERAPKYVRGVLRSIEHALRGGSWETRPLKSISL